MQENLAPVVSHDIDPDLVARYFVYRDSQRGSRDVSQMKVHKLMYLAQANYLASTGHRLVRETFEAFEHGPVAASLRPSYARYGSEPIADQIVASPPDLPDDVRVFLDAVWERFGGQTAASLRNLTHRHSPWVDHYSPGSYRCEIPDEELAEYFRQDIRPDERIVHPNAVVVPAHVWDQLEADEDDIVEQMVSALR